MAYKPSLKKKKLSNRYVAPRTSVVEYTLKENSMQHTIEKFHYVCGLWMLSYRDINIAILNTNRIYK